MTAVGYTLALILAFLAGGPFGLVLAAIMTVVHWRIGWRKSAGLCVAIIGVGLAAILVEGSFEATLTFPSDRKVASETVQLGVASLLALTVVEMFRTRELAPSSMSSPEPQEPSEASTSS